MTSASYRILLIALALVVSGCSGVYYDAMEQLGVAKRDLLVKRVVATQEEQEDAKEQFTSALDAFQAVVATEPSELQDRYERLNDELERSEDVADRVTDRIEKVESVAEALFDEWEDELDQYNSPDLRRRSEDQLYATRSRYGRLIGKMRQAESTMEPVLQVFQDQVLFLKHNLNAQAIASLQSEVTTLEAEVSTLIREMEAAIDEASAFIDSIETPS